MILTDKIDKFNNDFKGKEVYNCESLKSMTLAIDNYGAFLCCSSTVSIINGGLPKVFSWDENACKLNKELYIERYIDYFYNLQKTGAFCKGCTSLKTEEFNNFIKYESFKFSVVNNAYFHRCNVRCIYCDALFERNENDVSFILDNFFEEDTIDEETHIIHAYGEPTIHKNFSKYIKQALKLNAYNDIYSSGLLFNDEIYAGLLSNKTMLNISIDSGTPETYKKIKGIDGFKTVCENIKRYCETGGNVQIKYIVFSYNSSREDIDGFINMCIESNVKNVVISAEIQASIYRNQKIAWSFGENEVNACIYLLNACKANNINFFLIKTLFQKEDLRKIIISQYDELFNDKQYNNWKYCIFGAGKKGMELYENTTIIGLEIECFCDNEKISLATEYDIPCISVEQAVKIKDIKILIPYGRYSNEMKEQLCKLGFNNYLEIM